MKKRFTLLSKRAFAKSQKASLQTVQNWERAGMPVESNNKVDPLKALRWLTERVQKKSKRADLAEEKTRADVARINAIRVKAEVETATLRGELHSTAECQASVGQLLALLWIEITAFPSRGQSAHPETPGLEKTLIDIVNETAKRLSDFANSKHINLLDEAVKLVHKATQNECSRSSARLPRRALEQSRSSD